MNNKVRTKIHFFSIVYTVLHINGMLAFATGTENVENSHFHDSLKTEVHNGDVLTQGETQMKLRVRGKKVVGTFVGSEKKGKKKLLRVQLPDGTIVKTSHAKVRNNQK